MNQLSTLRVRSTNGQEVSFTTTDEDARKTQDVFEQQISPVLSFTNYVFDDSGKPSSMELVKIPVDHIFTIGVGVPLTRSKRVLVSNDDGTAQTEWQTPRRRGAFNSMISIMLKNPMMMSRKTCTVSAKELAVIFAEKFLVEESTAYTYIFLIRKMYKDGKLP